MANHARITRNDVGVSSECRSVLEESFALLNILLPDVSLLRQRAVVVAAAGSELDPHGVGVGER